jgi:hypothetical protein
VQLACRAYLVPDARTLRECSELFLCLGNRSAEHDARGEAIESIQVGWETLQ